MISANRIPGSDIVEEPKLKVNPVTFADTTFQAYAEKMADDYMYILKRRVVPEMPDLGRIKLRELRILASIDFFDNPISPNNIAELLRYDPATVSRAVNLLVGEGMMIRTKNTHDTRSVYLELTPEGKSVSRAFAKQVQVTFAELESQLLHGLTEQEKLDYLTIMVKLSKRSQTMRQITKGKRPSFY